jgi:hypothetical protein
LQLYLTPPAAAAAAAAAAAGDGGDAERGAIPMRVRQVATVELPADSRQPPESVLVLLEGGGEVVADRLSEQQPTDLPGHQVIALATSI